MNVPDFILSEPIGFHAPALAGWLVRRERNEQLLESMGGWKGREGQLSISDFVNGRRPYQVTAGGIAFIHCNEVLSRNATNIDKMFGDTHYNDLISELQEAAADPAVYGIYMDISSPGGSAIGAPEAAEAVARAAAVKPVVSYVETVGASAAYYFAAASNKIICSPSAVIGSIGTISMFPDISAMLEKFGVKMNIMTPKAADLKASGNSVRPMTDAERNFLQERIESINAGFVGWVQKYRPGAKEGTMRGQWFSGVDGMKCGLSDEVGSRDSVLRLVCSMTGGKARPITTAPVPGGKMKGVVHQQEIAKSQERAWVPGYIRMRNL